jgi:tetratricopeptide (TPR) repeat protein
VINRRRFSFSGYLPLFGAWLCSFTCWAAELDRARLLFSSGQYAECIAQTQKIVANRAEDEEALLLLSQALLMTGQYREARSAMTNALVQDSRSLRLRWQAREVFQRNGEREAAEKLVDEIIQRGASRPWAYREDAASLVILGRALLLRGLDPKRVLDTVFENARKLNPKLKDLYLASGQLALDKHDFDLAAKKFQEGLKQVSEDADLYYGLARAYASGDQSSMLKALNQALGVNSNHIGSLLLMMDHDIDAEDYSEAKELFERIKSINPWQPEAWAYRAVLAHLENEPDLEKSARETALKFWPDNPRVDHLIGLKLSQNYRFSEGATYQRQALQHDADYVSAKAQLAQDLLRLGDEGEGWKLAQEVQKQDGYDVQAYNLAALHDKMARFVTLTNDDFLLRMEAREASIYGAQVLQLLSEAKTNLCGKYGLELKRPAIVEIFPEQKDFAVRTFGMPGNPGYLGVCFGRVITANSPASRGAHPVNWQAVLWHEFCHIVTLQITSNKMPRWLSEGISVYEEIQANPSWGQHMNPQYREMILSGELTAVSKLSAAFLTPRSDLHLQFAYFEASLAVEFIVQRFGLDSLKGILRELGQGIEINAALQKHTMPIEKLDEEFSAFADKRANELASGLDFEKPEFAREEDDERPAGPRTKPRSKPNAQETWSSWSKDRPTNFWAMNFKAQELVEAKKWEEAKSILNRLIELYPGSHNTYQLLAAAHRALGETELESEVLARLAAKDHEALDAYSRLMELGAAAKNWQAVIKNARRYLAVNPLVALPYRFLAEASNKSNDAVSAIAAYKALLLMDPPDPAHILFHLAKLEYQQCDPAARRHVIQALEEAPRYRAALQLLLEIDASSSQAKIKPSEATSDLPKP